MMMMMMMIMASTTAPAPCNDSLAASEHRWRLQLLEPPENDQGVPSHGVDHTCLSIPVQSYPAISCFMAGQTSSPTACICRLCSLCSG